jgi:large subunit ribosomal protein L15e
MGLYKHLRQLYKRPKESLGQLWKDRLVLWRKEPSTLRIERPTRLDRARSLGYKAKQGIFMVRQRVRKGGHRKPNPFDKGGRRPKRNAQRLDLDKSYQVIAEQRTGRKYVNCEVLNSYWVIEDGYYKWYEVIMVDRDHPSVYQDKRYNGVVNQRNRAFRGLTSAGKKSRGLMHKGIGAEKLRPSRTANLKRRKG